MANDFKDYLQLIDHLLKKSFSEMDSENLHGKISEFTKLLGFYIKLSDLNQKEQTDIKKINQQKVDEQDQLIIKNFTDRILKKHNKYS